MSKILVTGANGFIGQHLVRTLVDQGHQVRAMVHGNHPLHFFQRHEVEWQEADLARPGSLQGICRRIDTVYHLASIPRNDLRRTWEDFVAVNIQGTRALLQESSNAGVQRFVFVSTVEAAGYGDGKIPRNENDDPKPNNNYGKSKLQAENLVLDEQWHMGCTVLRLPMIYGPGTFIIVPKLFGMVKWGFYPLFGSGRAKMEFCYVGNAIEAICLAGTKQEALGELFYVSDRRSYTIKEVIQTIAKAMQQRIVFIRIPFSLAWALGWAWEGIARIYPFPPVVSRYSKKPFFTRETVRWTTSNINTVSTEKIRMMLGFRPPVDIQTGCQLTSQWLKSKGI